MTILDNLAALVESALPWHRLFRLLPPLDVGDLTTEEIMEAEAQENADAS